VPVVSILFVFLRHDRLPALPGLATAGRVHLLGNPTQIRELDKGHALIQLTHGRDSYPVQKVSVERG
jgi:hypothetical protein